MLVEQDHLDEDAVRKYESTQSAVMLKELEMKGKRGTERDKLEEELKVLRREAKGAETVLTQRSRKKQEAIEAIRIQHLPIELAVADPAKAGEIQFGSRKAKTDVRGVYDRVMWGGTVHETAKTEIGTIANPTNLTGVVEVYGDNGELDAVIEEEVARRKAEGVSAKEAGVERSFNEELGNILAEGPEAIKKLVERVSVDEIRAISPEVAQRFIDTINMQIIFGFLASELIGYLTDKESTLKREKVQRLAVFADGLLTKTGTRDRFVDIRDALAKVSDLLT